MVKLVDRVGGSVTPQSGAGVPRVLIPPMCNAELVALLGESSGGDEVAFAALYDATAARAYGLSVRVLHDLGRAAGVVQEAYVHIWAHSACFEPSQGSAISWILTVVHQRAVSRMRSGASVAAGDPGASTTTGRTPSMVDLAATQRRAVELACCQGCTHAEVDLLRRLPSGTAHLLIRSELLHLHDTLAQSLQASNTPFGPTSGGGDSWLG